MTAVKKSPPLTPTKLSPQDYTQAVAQHLKTHEGAVPRIYTDANGIPTMGTGIALAVSGDGKTYTLRDIAEIGAEISGDPAKPYQFSDTEKKLLTDRLDFPWKFALACRKHLPSNPLSCDFRWLRRFGNKNKT